MSRFMTRILDWMKRRAVGLGLLAGPLILVGLPLLRGQVLYWGTPSAQFIPWWTEACRQLAQGRLPLWNSLNGMGAPLLANYQSAFLYPPNWLLLPFGMAAGAEGLALGFSLLALLHLVWAGWGMARLVESCGGSRLAQFMAGAAFALGGYLIARLEFFSMVWTAAWLPWVICAASRLASPAGGNPPLARFHFSPRLAATVALMLLAGHAQLSWYIILLTIGWVLAGALGRPPKQALWPLLSLAAAGLAGALIASAQLLPTAEYLLQSQRSGEYGYAAAVAYSFWPWRLVTLLAPDFFGNPGLGNYWGYASYWEDALYVGILPLALALSTLGGVFRSSHPWAGTRLPRFLWLVIVISVLLALGKNTPVFPFLYRFVPTFDMFQAPARYLLWAVFALAILAAAGAERWNCPRGRGLYWLRLGTAGAFAVTLGAGLAWFNLEGREVTFIRATALAGLWGLGGGVLTLSKPFFVRRGTAAAWACIAAAWVTADLLAAGWWLNPTVESAFYAEMKPAIAALKHDLATARVYMPASVEEQLKFRRFFRAADYRPQGEAGDMRASLLPNTNLLDGVAMVNNFDPMVPQRFARWVETLEALSQAEQAAWLRLAGVGAVVRLDASQPGGARFERLEPARRFPIYACAEWEETSSPVSFGAAAREPVRLLVEGAGGGQNCQPALSGWADPRRIEAGSFRFSVSSADGGWLLVEENWYPGWWAWVDGAPSPLLRADYLFMAVAVPQGEHEIRLEYHPVSFASGVFLSILTSISCLFVALKRRSLD